MSDSSERRVLPPGASVNEQRGKWIGRIKRHDGSRSGVTLGSSVGPESMSRACAEESLASLIESGAVRVVLKVRGGEKISDIAKRWIPIVRSDASLKKMTRNGHIAHVEGEILRVFGNMLTDELDTGTIRQWIQGNAETRSASRTRALYFTLHKMMRAAESEKWIKRFPWNAEEIGKCLPAQVLSERARTVTIRAAIKSLSTRTRNSDQVLDIIATEFDLAWE